MKEKIIKYFPLIMLFLLSLTPIIWFVRKPGYLINGTDTNFPFDPISWFLQRLYVFQTAINAGIDWPTATAGIFFHALQIVAYLPTGNLILTELLSSVFWFFLILTSMYYLLGVLWGGKNIGARLLGTIFYSFNIYLFNSWENIKVSNLSLIATAPFLLGFAYQAVKKPEKKSVYFLLALLFAFVGSGSGINPAYFLVGYFMLFSFGLFLLLTSKGIRKQVAKTLLQYLLIVFFANSFWLFPLFASLLGASGKTLSSLSSLTDLNWLEGVSAKTNLLGILRLQGAWDWYESGLNNIPYVPFAQIYFNNPFFILLSLAIPALVIIGFTLTYTKKFPFFFLFLVFLGVILGTGTHMPFGIIYRRAVAVIPFFSFFRSPWYIFTPFTVTGYSVLLAGLIVALSSRIGSRNANWLAIILSVVLLVYSYPLLIGDIFRPNKQIGQSLYIKPPAYLYKARNILKNVKSERFLSLPFNETENFNWGYSGVGSILNLISDKNAVVRRFGLKEKSMLEILGSKMADALKADLKNQVKGLALLSGIDGLFVKYDLQDSNKRIIEVAPNKAITPAKIVKTGKWKFIFLPEKNKRIFVGKQTVSIYGDREKIGNIFDFIKPEAGLTFYLEQFPADIFRYKWDKRPIFIFPKCVDCLLREQEKLLITPFVSVLPSSRFYNKTEEVERKEANDIVNINERLQFYLASSLRLSAEIEQMVVLKHDREIIIASMERLLRQWQEIVKTLMLLVDEKGDSWELHRNIGEIERYLNKEIATMYAISNSAFITFEPRIVAFRITNALQLIGQTIKKREWRSDSESKKFLFTVLEENDYNLFVKLEPKLSRFFTKDLAESKVFIGGKKIPMKISSKKNWLVGRVEKLEKGHYRLEIKLPRLINVLSGSFKPLKLNIETVEGIKETSLPFKSFIPNRMYRLVFYYRTDQGVEPRIYIKQDSDRLDRNRKLLHAVDAHLDKDTFWRRYEEFFIPREKTKKASLVFITSSVDNVKSINQIKDLKVELMYQPTVVLYNLVKPHANFYKPDIFLRAKSPTKYIIDVKNASGSFPLIFLNDFSRAWKVRIDSKLLPLSEDKHFLVNGFGNGWVVDKAGDYQLTIEYWPQYLFYIGAGVVVIMFIYLLVKHINKNYD